MKFIPLADGTFVRSHSPLENWPFYSNWLEKLLDRRAAYVVREKDTRIGSPTFGELKESIKPYDGNQEQAAEVQEDGTVRIICLGCAEPTPYRSIVQTSTSKGHDTVRQLPTGKIRIGAIVQMGVEEPCHEQRGGMLITADRRWRLRTVGRMGWGCPACLSLFTDEANRIANENYQKVALYEAMVNAYVLRRDIEKLSKLAKPKEHTAFLDVFNRSVTAGQFPEFMQL